MKLIIGALGVVTVAFVVTVYSICKVVNDYDQAEEERMRELYYGIEKEDEDEREET